MIRIYECCQIHYIDDGSSEFFLTILSEFSCKKTIFAYIIQNAN